MCKIKNHSGLSTLEEYDLPLWVHIGFVYKYILKYN